MDTKHTSGPWREAADGWIDSDVGPVVEYAGCGSHEAEWHNPADKALCLAAPALLAACQAMVNGWGSGNDEEAAIEAMRAVIARATGQKAEA